MGQLLKRWGSCTKKSNNECQLEDHYTPMSIVNYVVVHELCHLRKPSHSPAFWILFKGAHFKDYLMSQWGLNIGQIDVLPVPK